MNQKQKVLDRHRQSLQAAIEKATAALSDQLSGLTQRVMQLEQQVAVFQLRQEMTDEQSRWREERRQLLEQLESTNELLRRAQEQLHSRPVESVEHFEQVEPLEERSDPISADEEEVFARLRAMSLLKEPVSTDADGRPIARRGDDLAYSTHHDFRRDSAGVAAGSQEAREHEMSIEDYMARLLNRTRGTDGDTYRTPHAAWKPSIDVAPPDKPGPAAIEPRAKAPETTVALAVMREIANLSARAAITKHHFRDREHRARRTWEFAMVSATIAAVLLCFADDFHSPFLFGGVAAVLVSLCLFARAASRVRKARVLVQSHDRPQSDASSRPASPPVVPDSEDELALETAAV